MITLVPHEEIPREWSKVEPLLAKAIVYNSGPPLTLADIYADLIENRTTLWASFRDDEPDEIDGCLVFRTFADCSSWIDALAVKPSSASWKAPLEPLNSLLKTIEQYAKDIGCTSIGAASRRKGWLRFAERYGYTPVAYIVSKEL